MPKGAILHSDQGATYTSKEFFQVAKQKNIIRSMSRKGTPSDNAPIESFHSSLKSETFLFLEQSTNLSQTRLSFANRLSKKNGLLVSIIIMKKWGSYKLLVAINNGTRIIRKMRIQCGFIFLFLYPIK